MEKNTEKAVRSGTDRRVTVFWLLGTGVIAILMILLTPSRSANAAGPTKEFPVSGDGTNQLAPAIGGSLVVWEGERDGLSGIYAKKLPDGAEFLIYSGPNVKKGPVTSSGYVVWEDHRSGDADIYGYDLSSQTEFPIATGVGEQRDPAISGDTVVWEGNQSGRWEIYRYELSTRQEFQVTTGAGNQTNPAISGNTVAWQDDRNGTGNSDIYARNLRTGEEFAVSTGEAYADMPAISGGIVVWRQEAVANYDIFGRDLYARDPSSDQVFQVTTDSSDQVAPAISGHVIVWEDHCGGNAAIFGKDLSTGEVFQITSDAAPQETPDISGETVVWESQRISETNYGSYEVRGARLDTAPAVPRGLEAAGSLRGVTLDWKANADKDLAGYNIYRSGSQSGPYTKLNANLLPRDTLSYKDADAMKGSASHYQVTAVDAAGNESGPARVKSAAQARTKITLKVRSPVVKYGRATRLSGRLTSGGEALSGNRVIVQQKVAGARGFSRVRGGFLTTSETGGFSMRVKPRRNTTYRVRFNGEPDVGLRPSTGPRRWVRVKPRVSLAEPRHAGGSRLYIRGRVAEVKGGEVRVVIRRDGKIIARRNSRLNDSSYRFFYRAPNAGRYTARASFGETFAHLGDRSSLKKFRTLRLGHRADAFNV